MSNLNRLYDKWMAAYDRRIDAELEANQLEKEYHAAYASSTREEKRAHLICLNGHDWDLED
jgi:hypothetical protein